MSSVLVEAGAMMPLQIVLEDQSAIKFPRATLIDPNGVTLTTRSMAYAGSGVYFDIGYPMPAAHDNVFVLYEVFEDVGYTTPSQYYPDLVTYNKDKGISEITEAIKGAVTVQGDVAAMVDDDTDMTLVSQDDSTAGVTGDALAASVGSDDLAAKSDTGDLTAKADEDDLTSETCDC